MEKPHSAPIMTPTTILMAVQTNEMMMEFLAPAQTASKTSLPTWSVPKMCSALGFRNFISALLMFGVLMGL